MPFTLVLLYSNGGLTGRASVWAVIVQVLLWGTNMALNTFAPDWLPLMYPNLWVRLVGGLLAIGLLKIISIITYTITTRLTKLVTKKHM